MTARPNETPIFGNCETCSSRIELTIEKVLTFGNYLGSFSFAVACVRCLNGKVVIKVNEHLVDELIRQRNVGPAVLSR